MENSTTIKRVKIIVVILVAIGVITLIVNLIKAPAATCNDGKQNQGEKAVDCGGPCSPCQEAVQTKDIVVQETAFALGGNNTYDVVAKISNPNNSVGAKNFVYTFTLKDASGISIATRQAAGFILPGDTRYVAQLGLEIAGSAVPVKVEITISQEQWQKIAGVFKPTIGVYNKKFDESQLVGSSVEGTIRNESDFDLKEIDVVIILRDEKGNIVGINTTRKDSVRAKEDQYFRVTWPYPLGAAVQSVEVDPQSNIFDPQDFSAASN